MNPRKSELRTLLDDVLPAAGVHCGPSAASIRAMVRLERSRRCRVRMALTTGATFALAALLLVWHRPRSVEAPIAASQEPAPIAIRDVNDEQLAELLQDTPTAMLEWPNGERTLFVVAHQTPPSRAYSQ